MSSISAGDTPSRDGRVAVDHERRLEAAVLLVARDVGEAGHGAELLHELRRPGAESSSNALALQRVLVLRAARAPADAEVLHRLEERRRAGDCASAGRSRAITSSASSSALVARLQRDEHARRVLRVAAAAAAARERDHVVDRRVARG